MKADFYILENSNKQQAMLFACKLAEKAHAGNEKMYIHTTSADEAEKLDKLLWTYRDDSFLPHELVSADSIAPILIGHTIPANNMTGTLLNFHREIPAFYTQFNHIIEIVHNDPSVQQLARERFRQYRDAGIAINTHKLKASDL